ncbi:HAMP domain-containing histidine kinase [Cyanobium sp. FGCU-52]|nr:HAMP domain-containing histidine kinase [Cyanobium sp. FGCU52]
MSRSSRLDRSDWAKLLLWWLLGCGLSFSVLILLLHTLLEPQLQAESSLRISRSVALVEEVLRRLPPERIPPGVLLKSSSTPPEGSADGLTSFDRELQQRLAQQYGLRRDLQRDRPPLVDPWGGYWIRLQVPGQNPPLWLYQPERLSSSSAWFLPLLRTSAVFFGVLLGTVGFLHWRIEIPFTQVLSTLPDTSQAPLPLLPERGIAPLRLLTVRINRLLERINDVDAARRSLLRGLAHDLAGPQTRLMLQVESLERQAGPETRSTTQALAADLQQLGRITEQLTLLADREATPSRRLDLALDDFCRRLAASYSGGAVEVVMRRQLIRIDSVALERALRNLIDNAIEHGRPPVRLSAWTERGVLNLVVDDHGSGMLTPTRRTISGPPPASDRGRRRHRGLGLEIVEGFCRENGGQLHLETSPQGGLRARIVLRPTAANPLLL